MDNQIKLVNMARYYEDLPGQNEALNFIESRLSEGTLTKAAELYRDNPLDAKFTQINATPNRNSRVVLPNFPLYIQHDNKGDHDRDGRPDAWQTCNVTPTALDRECRSKIGSRYNHGNLVKLMARHGVTSRFSVSTPNDSIKACLRAGQPVIWSNKLTHGGHIVVVIGYDDTQKKYLIADPWGEPSPTNSSRTRWSYNKAARKPYWLNYSSFDTVNANGYNYHKKEHWCHLTSKAGH